jgi:hypothetical protein
MFVPLFFIFGRAPHNTIMYFHRCLWKPSHHRCLYPFFCLSESRKTAHANVIERFLERLKGRADIAPRRWTFGKEPAENEHGKVCELILERRGKERPITIPNVSFWKGQRGAHMQAFFGSFWRKSESFVM